MSNRRGKGRKDAKFPDKLRLAEYYLLMGVLPKYGAHAKPHLPRLKEMAPGGRFEKPWAAMIKSIEEAPPAKKMISLKEAKKAGAQ